METNQDVIEFQSLVCIMSMFKFNCTIEDEKDLRYWLFNKEVITTTPKFHMEDRLYLHCNSLIKALKRNATTGRTHEKQE
jgi:hypothetical protein